jgi:tellurite resistance protein TehA-like permease
MSDDLEPVPKQPTLFRNYISFAGTVVVTASLVSIILLLLIDLFKADSNPYTEIVTFMILPGFLVLGLFIIVGGMMYERRRRRLSPGSPIPEYPRIDFNEPQQRKVALTLTGVSFLFIFMSAFGSYRAYEYTESVEFCGKTCHAVMKPEFVAFNATSHARIRCVRLPRGPRDRSVCSVET